MNEHLDSLVTDLRQRFSIEAAGMTTGEWVTKNTTFRTQPFSFEGYEFQRKIMDDLHPNLEVIKISQVGLTEIQMRKACALLARNNGLVGMFSLAEEKMYRKFSQTRLKPFIEENRVFTSKSGEGVRSIDTIQIGASFLHIVNATESAATSTSADFLFNDEVDLSDQKVLALFASRLQNSTWKIKQRFSTPSWSGYGIDGTYAVTDQQEYFCRCHHCGFQQVPLYDERFVRIPGLSPDIKLTEITDDIAEGLDLSQSFIMCERCHRPLDVADPTQREWVPAFPSRKNARGYRVRPFSSPRISIPYILQQMLDYRRNDYIRGWHNTVIGEAYIDGQARLEETQIKAVMTSETIPVITSTQNVFIGIDVGATCHITLGTDKGAFAFLVVKASELVSKVKELDAQYNIVSGIIDRNPYTPTAEAVRDITNNRIMPTEYGDGPELKPVKDPTHVITHWQCNRTKSLDYVVRVIRNKSIMLAGYGIHSRVLIEHLRDMVRDESPEKPARWVKLTGTDHYFHSLGYMLLSQKLPGVLALLTDQETRDTLMVTSVTMKQPPPLLRTKKKTLIRVH